MYSASFHIITNLKHFSISVIHSYLIPLNLELLYSNNVSFLVPGIGRDLKIHLLQPSCRRRRWHPTPVLLPGKSHGRRSLVGCSPWGHKESDMTEKLHFHFSLACIGEGNGNPLQCSCLENLRDGGACWAAVYGVAQSRTRSNLAAAAAATFLPVKALPLQHSQQTVCLSSNTSNYLACTVSRG